MENRYAGVGLAQLLYTRLAVDLKIRKSLPHLTTVFGVFSQELWTPAPCTGRRVITEFLKNMEAWMKIFDMDYSQE